MARNYKQLTESIQRSLNPENILLTKAFSDELSSISYSDALTFVRMAMKAVEPEYTKRTRDAGDRVKDHLDKELQDKNFRYQGSVMTDTHIKGYSDIDLLVISSKFYSWDANRVNEILDSPTERNKFWTSTIKKLEHEKSISSYTGNSLEDLRKLRIDSENILTGVYNTCDITQPKAIRIKNLSLNREVDIVIANWYDDVRSIMYDKGDNRGVQVYNKITNTQGRVDYPFVSINRINERSSSTNGRLKKMIRFMKNVKAHSDLKIDLSSFDINAICYDIDTSKYDTLAYNELVRVIYEQLYSICNDIQHANDVVSVDDREYIFRNQPGKLSSLRLLMGEIQSIYSDLKVVPIYG